MAPKPSVSWEDWSEARLCAEQIKWQFNGVSAIVLADKSPLGLLQTQSRMEM
jgi:hypothetical protein